MFIAFSCEKCGKKYRVPTDKAGKRTKCAACGNPLVVPDEDPGEYALAEEPPGTSRLQQRTIPGEWSNASGPVERAAPAAANESGAASHARTPEQEARARLKSELFELDQRSSILGHVIRSRQDELDRFVTEATCLQQQLDAVARKWEGSKSKARGTGLLGGAAVFAFGPVLGGPFVSLLNLRREIRELHKAREFLEAVCPEAIPLQSEIETLTMELEGVMSRQIELNRLAKSRGRLPKMLHYLGPWPLAMACATGFGMCCAVLSLGPGPLCLLAWILAILAIVVSMSLCVSVFRKLQATLREFPVFPVSSSRLRGRPRYIAVCIGLTVLAWMPILVVSARCVSVLRIEPRLENSVAQDDSKWSEFTDAGGRFRCRIPPGEQVQQVESDVRSKVQLKMGDAEIGIIVRETASSEITPEHVADVAERFRQDSAAKEITLTIVDTNLVQVAGHPALHIRGHVSRAVPGLFQRVLHMEIAAVKCVWRGYDHSITLTASSRVFPAATGVLETILRSYEPRPAAREFTDAGGRFRCWFPRRFEPVQQESGVRSVVTGETDDGQVRILVRRTAATPIRAEDVQAIGDAVKARVSGPGGEEDAFQSRLIQVNGHPAAEIAVTSQKPQLAPKIRVVKCVADGYEHTIVQFGTQGPSKPSVMTYDDFLKSYCLAASDKGAGNARNPQLVPARQEVLATRFWKRSRARDPRSDLAELLTEPLATAHVAEVAISLSNPRDLMLGGRRMPRRMSDGTTMQLMNYTQHDFVSGAALKLNDVYHFFISGIVGDRNIAILHWTSRDWKSWELVSTLHEAKVRDALKDDQVVVKNSPIPVFNALADRWELFYIAYKCSPPALGFGEGRVCRAVSTVAGQEGIDGPYRDAGVVLELGADSDYWEGLEGIGSFFPYAVGDTWYGLYGSATNWPERHVGFVSATSLAGPWRRCYESNPACLHGEFATITQGATAHGTLSELSRKNPVVFCTVSQNYPVVFRVPSGKYVAVFASGPFQDEKAGYIVSADGIHWTPAQVLPGSFEDQVPTAMLGVIPEADDAYRLFYCFHKAAGKRYYQDDVLNLEGRIGMATLTVKE